MQYLDDDMRELFRKASEDIRLRPENDDWEKIQKRLLPDVSTLPGLKTSSNYRLWVYTFVLLFISGASGLLLKNGTDLRIGNETIAGHTHSFKTEHIIKTKHTGATEIKSPGKNSSAVINVKLKRSLSNFASFKAGECNGLFEAEQKIADPLAISDEDLLRKHGANLKSDLFKNIESNKNQTSIPNGKRFYVGIIAGPQFSQTKQQKFSNAGLSAGILLGFHLNSRLSVESGFIISNKQFGSDGQYFDRSKISGSMPSGMKLIHVQSKINELEIPINIKYDLLKIKKGDLFVSGGISSYILTNENNQYQASLNGNHETMVGNYPEHQNYFAAAINIGAGYESKAVKNINIRIEPYFQIPIKKIGMGSMHVMSTGVYLGITIPVIK